MNAPSYDLTTAGWLPVVDLSSGEIRQVGLTEALTRAHELRLATTSPQEAVVLLRLLLAVYDAAAGPADTGQWDRAWRAEVADPHGRIADYLARWRDRFDLFHPTMPFAQCGHLTEYRRGREVLDPAYLGGAGGEWFNPGLRDPARYPPHPPEQAAVNLLVLIGYDVAGIKGAPPGTGTKGKSYGAQLGLAGALPQLHLHGRTLKDTLLLNLPPQPHVVGDAPLWERPCPPPEPGTTRTPTGRLDYLTWPSRRIRLQPDRDGRVHAVAWYDGDRVDGGYQTCLQLDHLAPHRRVARKGGALGASVLVDDHFKLPLSWQVVGLMHPAAPGADPASSAVLDHALDAARRGVVPADYPLRAEVSTALYNTHGSVLTGIAGGTVDLGPIAVHRGPHADTVAHLVRATTALLLVVRSKARELLPHVADVGNRVRIDPSATERAWSTLLADLAELPDDGDPLPVLTRYHAAMREQFDHAVGTLPLGGPRGVELRARLERAIAAASAPLLRPQAPEDTAPVEAAAPAPRRGRPSPEVTIGEETKTLAQWADDPRCVVTKAALRQRINAGWPPEAALTTPARAPRPDTTGDTLGKNR
ncbi:type I-E CRISPR-associated protein Cse1/CasA [Actinosynnema sp. NPDC051121]